MLVDPRFELEVKHFDDSVALILRAREGLTVDEMLPILLTLSFEEVANLLSLSPEAHEILRDRKKRGIFSNGWQSWSFAGELFDGEEVRPARLIPALNNFAYRPGPLERRGKVVSHLFTHIRSGQGRLIMVSRGPSPEKAGAPIAFIVDRRDLGIQVEAFAGGTAFDPGMIVAELRLAWRDGFFAERDFLKDVFTEHRHFFRLAFLENKTGLVPGGYESWYNHYTAITDRIIREDLAGLTVNENLINSYYIRRGKPTVFQIDDGWEQAVGDWRPHAVKFPEGMAALGRDIDAAGLIAGLWVAPFIVTRSSSTFSEKSDWLLRDVEGRLVVAGWNNTWDGNFFALDLSIPEVADYLDDIFERIVDEWGYRYLKLDFLYAGMLEGRRRHGGAAWEHYDRVVTRITSRQADRLGRRLAWLGCGAPLEASFRAFPLMRIGADTRETWEYQAARILRHQGRPAAHINLLHTIGRCALDGALFINDPDVIFCREGGVEHGEREKELIALVAKLLASQIMFSDNAGQFGKGGEIAFTQRIVALYDRLSRHEFGAERIAREVFTIWSRDGLFRGYINLRSRSYVVRDVGTSSLVFDESLTLHAEKVDGALKLEPRSLSLFAL